MENYASLKERLINHDESLEALNTTAQALMGFSAMLSNSLHTKWDDISFHEHGICQLLERQVEDLHVIQETLRVQIEEIGAQQLELDDLAEIAKRTQLPAHKVRLVLAIALGTDPFKSDWKDDFADDRKREYTIKIASREAEIKGEVMALIANREQVASLINSSETSGDKLRDFFIHYMKHNLETARVASLLGIDQATVHAVLLYIALPGMSLDRLASDITSRELTAEEEWQRRAGSLPTPEKMAALLKSAIDRETETTAKELREQFLAEKIVEGLDAGAIAQVLNLKKATVERVIGQLLAGKADDGHSSADLSGKIAAENRPVG